MQHHPIIQPTSRFQPTAFRFSLGLIVCLLAVDGAAANDGVRYVESDGVTYRETRRIERRPVTTTQWEERSRTVYTPEYVTEMRDSVRTVYTPVVEYRCEPRWHNWWNPFTPPYVAYHMKPVHRWEPRVERYRTPVTYRQVVPETRVVQVPVRSLTFEEREVVERIAVTPRARANGSAPQVAERVGGISRIDNDPPRYGNAIDRGTVIRR